MTFLNHQLIGGPSPCHVSVDDQNQFVLTANYHSGKVHVFSGSGRRQLAITCFRGRSHRKRAARKTRKPHTHYAGFTPEHNYVVAVDLGIDKLYTYKLKDGVLTESGSHSFAPGAGPRHIAFHPKEKYAYVMTELSNEVIALEYNPTAGEFREIQVVSAIPDDFTDNSQGSAIHVTQDGRLFMSQTAAMTVSPYLK